MRHSRALPANAREAVEGETPAAAATCSRVTGSAATGAPAIQSRKKLEISLHNRLCNGYSALSHVKCQPDCAANGGGFQVFSHPDDCGELAARASGLQLDSMAFGSVRIKAAT